MQRAPAKTLPSQERALFCKISELDVDPICSMLRRPQAARSDTLLASNTGPYDCLEERDSLDKERENDRINLVQL